MVSALGLDSEDLRYFLHAARARTLAGAARALRVEHTRSAGVSAASRRRLVPPSCCTARRGCGSRRSERRSCPSRSGSSGPRHDPRAGPRRGGPRPARCAVGLHAALHARLAQLHAERPGLALELLSGARSVDLMKGEADLAIRAGPITDKELIARRRCVSGWSLYAADAYLGRRPGPLDPQYYFYVLDKTSASASFPRIRSSTCASGSTDTSGPSDSCSIAGSRSRNSTTDF
jgi:DNA-binding transcriptional LysR family regulator